MNNTVFGKTMENLRNHVDVKFVRIWETDTIRRLVASPLEITRKVYTYLAQNQLSPEQACFTGMTIFDNSKILMYDVFYNYLKSRCRCDKTLVWYMQSILEERKCKLGQL